MKSRGRWGSALGVVGALILAGCAQEAAPLLREDFDRVRTDLQRVEQTLQRSQAEIKAELQQTDRRSAQTLAEIQRSVARVGSRLDELGRESGQIQGRLDELRRRVDALALQFDVAGPQGGISPAGRSGGGASRPSEATSPSSPVTGGGPTPSPGGLGPKASNPSTQASDFYQTAYIDYTRGNYNLAIAAFKEFIRLYPSTDLAEKAQYWIGESHFSLARDLQTRGERDKATQEFERAVQEFRRLLITYPRGDRVPTALYKEALTLLELGQPSLAEARLQFLLDQFPSTEEAAKAKDQLARLRKR